MNLKETEKENDQKWVRKRHTELKQYSIHSFNGLEHKTSIVLYLQNPWYNRFANLKLKSKYLSTENKFYSILIDLDEIKKQNDLMYPFGINTMLVYFDDFHYISKFDLILEWLIHWNFGLERQTSIQIKEWRCHWHHQ